MPTAKTPRKRKTSHYRSFRVSKRIKPPVQKKIPAVSRVMVDTIKHMMRNWKPFLGLILVYVILNLIFVKGFASTLDIPSIREELISSGTTGASTNTALLGVLFTSGNTASTDVGTLYQSAILLIVGLATIWLFRFSSSDKPEKIAVKQPFYEGMGPLIPFLLVLCVIGLQLLPMLAGLGIFSSVMSNGLAVTLLEQLLWALLALSLSLLSFYLVSSSMFALIIVTLPDTAPLSALRSARKVVEFRRLTMMRKLFMLTIISMLGFGLLMLVCIALVPVIAEWVFLILGGVLLPIVIGTIYKLYRALL